MSKEKSEEQTRKEFYGESKVKQHIKTAGAPKTVGAFRDMVASGSGANLDGPEGSKLIEILRGVSFSTHPQQINIMDKTSGENIASIAT